MTESKSLRAPWGPWKTRIFLCFSAFNPWGRRWAVLGSQKTTPGPSWEPRQTLFSIVSAAPRARGPSSGLQGRRLGALKRLCFCNIFSSPERRLLHGEVPCEQPRKGPHSPARKERQGDERPAAKTKSTTKAKAMKAMTGMKEHQPGAPAFIIPPTLPHAPGSTSLRGALVRLLVGHLTS